MKSKISRRTFGVAACAFLLGAALPACAAPDAAKTPAAKPEAPMTGMSYLDNGKIKVGVNLDLGGAITYLFTSGSDNNLVNSADWGRQIQMSFYSGPVPFASNGKQPRPEWAGLGWNPIQSGDVAGIRSRVLAHKNDGKEMYTKCIPMQWPLDNVPGECTFETWISLRGNVVDVRCRLNNARSDKTQYLGRSQELPAVYTNGPWYRLVTYDGDKPFTNDATSDKPIVFPWTGWQATENWTALVDKNGFGLGIVAPDTFSTIGGFAGTPGAGGPKDGPTGYIAPLHQDILDHNIVYDYHYHLIVGDLSEIRRQAATLTPHAQPPNYVFAKDRQHWIYGNATDTGWPIRGALKVKLDRADPQLYSPDAFWPAAKAPKLYVKAAFHGGGSTAQIFWNRFDARDVDAKRSITFPLVSDGKMRVYAVDLSKSPEYKGDIIKLRFDPTDGGQAGASVEIKSIGFVKPLASTRKP